MENKQFYQQVSKVILEEIVLNPIDFKKNDYQAYFYKLKGKEPEKYKRLTFDTNRAEPYCKDLSRIFDNLFLCGFIDLDRNLIVSSMKRINEYLK